jgi:5-hydroxyisourate hydrolase
MGRLTTHVLDTAAGMPAEGMKIEVWQLSGTTRHLKTVTTNSDGRAGEPVLEGDQFSQGTYELRFHAGDYLRRRDSRLPSSGFLDIIPIRFGVDDANQHYHVPLLLSPYGYSTYRGS